MEGKFKHGRAGDRLGSVSQEHILREMEDILKQAAEKLPEPKRGMPVLPGPAKQEIKARPRRAAWRMAAALFAAVLLGGSTAVAASPDLRHAVIQFFSGGAKEKIPFEELAEKVDGPDAGGSAPNNGGARITAGDVTVLQNQVLDEHFTASYLSSTKYLDSIKAPSGKELFYTLDGKRQKRTYYELSNGALEVFTPKEHSRRGSIVLEKLPGIMYAGGPLAGSALDAGAFRGIALDFRVDWQQVGEDILVLNKDIQRIVIEAGTAEDTLEGSFFAVGLAGEAEWVEVFLQVDAQATGYQYPFLFNLQTGQVRDLLAGVDLSGYPCIIDLAFSGDLKSISAKAGQNQEALRPITIDLATGKITEEHMPDVPVEGSYMSFATGAHTVFYAMGEQERMDGFLYDEKKGTTKRLFHNAAWGYMWEDGFADTYVSLIGGNYAAVYKEPENEVYLLNLADGEKQLLQGIPASRDISFFWNPQWSMLSIADDTEAGTSRLAFFIPGTKHAWYFDRELADGVQEVSACWYSERAYIIQAESEKEGMYYLYLYKYTP